MLKDREFIREEEVSSEIGVGIVKPDPISDSDPNPYTDADAYANADADADKLGVQKSVKSNDSGREVKGPFPLKLRSLKKT